MDQRSEDFGKPDYLALLNIPLATLSDGTPTDGSTGLAQMNERSAMPCRRPVIQLP